MRGKGCRWELQALGGREIQPASVHKRRFLRVASCAQRQSLVQVRIQLGAASRAQPRPELVLLEAGPAQGPARFHPDAPRALLCRLPGKETFAYLLRQQRTESRIRCRVLNITLCSVSKNDLKLLPRSFHVHPKTSAWPPSPTPNFLKSHFYC